MAKDDRLLRIKDVCAHIAMSRSWVYQEIDAERFPAGFLMGRSRVWRLSTIESWIKEREDK